MLSFLAFTITEYSNFQYKFRVRIEFTQKKYYPCSLEKQRGYLKVGFHFSNIGNSSVLRQQICRKSEIVDAFRELIFCNCVIFGTCQKCWVFCKRRFRY